MLHPHRVELPQPSRVTTRKEKQTYLYSSFSTCQAACFCSPLDFPMLLLLFGPRSALQLVAHLTPDTHLRHARRVPRRVLTHGHGRHCRRHRRAHRRLWLRRYIVARDIRSSRVCGDLRRRHCRLKRRMRNGHRRGDSGRGCRGH